MLEAMYVYMEDIFFMMFGCRTSSPKGLSILLAFDLFFFALTIYLASDMKDTRLRAGHDER